MRFLKAVRSKGKVQYKWSGEVAEVEEKYIFRKDVVMEEDSADKFSLKIPTLPEIAADYEQIKERSRRINAVSTSCLH